MCSCTSIQALSHSYIPFPNIFVQMFVFCKISYEYLSNTSFVLTQNFVSFIAHWHVLDIAWPKYQPIKCIHQAIRGHM